MAGVRKFAALLPTTKEARADIISGQAVLDSEASFTPGRPSLGCIDCSGTGWVHIPPASGLPPWQTVPCSCLDS